MYGDRIAGYLLLMPLVVLLLPDTTETRALVSESNDLLPEQEHLNSTIQKTNGTRLPYKFYLKAYSYMHNSHLFKNYSLEDAIKWVDDIDSWPVPGDMASKFPYYLAGYDFDERPIWVGEVGNWDVRSVAEQGEEALADLEKLVYRAAIHVLQSGFEKDQPGKEIRHAVALLDCEGLNIRQITHARTFAFVLEKAQLYLDLAEMAIEKIVIINANFVAKMGLNSLRPVIGGLMERFEFFGTNKIKWMAALRRMFPEDAIPTWYGGREDFKPLKVYG